MGCVTGAAGYVGGWIVTLSLERGYKVRACVRNVDDDKKAGFLKSMPAYKMGQLTLHSADMTKPGSYDEVFEGCSTVFHPAEVFMSFAPGRDVQTAREEFTVNTPGKVGVDSLGGAARTTAMNIVNSINKSSTVTRLIYTSSIAAMATGFGNRPPVVDESC